MKVQLVRHEQAKVSNQVFCIKCLEYYLLQQVLFLLQLLLRKSFSFIDLSLLLFLDLG